MPRTGRPREFDRAAAVDRALLLFWEQGYEATSLSQLKEAMGPISTASFYAAFGSKESLFREVLGRYLGTYGRAMDALRDEMIVPRDAVEGALLGSARMQTDLAHPPGCLVTLATTMCSPSNVHLRELLADERDRNRTALRRAVGRALERGELVDVVDPDALAAMFDTFLVGLATQARDGVPAATLEAAVARVMSVWDAMAPRRAPGRTGSEGVVRADRA